MEESEPREAKPSESDASSSGASAVAQARDAGLLATAGPLANYIVVPDYELPKLLGSFLTHISARRGGQGEIMLVTDETGRPWAAKFPRSDKQGKAGSKAEQVARELRIWSTLADYLHVASLHEIGRAFGGPVLLLAYAELGNLAEYIESRSPPDDSPVADAADGGVYVREPIDWMIQLAYGLAFLHDSMVVHCDIKPPNILVYHDRERPEFPLIKICDLGLSAPGEWRDDQLIAESLGWGTSLYRAPEQLERERMLSDKCDSWSFGVCLLEAVLAGLPTDWPDAKPQECLASFRKHCRTWHGESWAPSLVDGLAADSPPHETLCSFIESCLQPTPSDRPNMATAIATLTDVYRDVGDDGLCYFRRQPALPGDMARSEQMRREMLIKRDVDLDADAARVLEQQWKEQLSAEAEERQRRRDACNAARPPDVIIDDDVLGNSLPTDENESPLPPITQYRGIRCKRSAFFAVRGCTEASRSVAKSKAH